MQRIKGLLLATILLLGATLANAQATTKQKCMIQMKSYQGQGAYIAISLIGKDGKYEKTLYVLGPDKEWYPDWKEWHKSNKKNPAKLDGITGASVTGGDRAVVTLEIETAKIDAGYKIRFETAVEDKQYYVSDVEIPLTKASLSAKTEGTGYIRYIRFSGN